MQLIDYKNLQKLMIYLKKCKNLEWGSVYIKDIEYSNLFDEDDDDSINIIEELIVNDAEKFSNYEDIITLDCEYKKFSLYFRIKILISDDNFLIYISYMPGNIDNKFNVLLTQLAYKWDSIVPGFLLFNYKDNISEVNLEDNNKNKFILIVKSLNMVMDKIEAVINEYKSQQL